MNRNGTSRAVLITGCSSGIGHVTALHLAERGWKIYATARKPDAIADLAAAGCETLALDVTDERSMQAAVSAVQEREGAVGVLVNNAGYGQSGAIEAIPLEDVRRQFETNLFGMIRMCQLVLPGMRRQGWGRIVNMSSVAGRVVMPGSGVYASTKFAIEAFSDVLRFEVRGFGIDVVVIEPGPTRTAFTDRANAAMPQPEGEAGVYAGYQSAVAKADAEADQSRLAGEPEAVAKAVERAISARRPKTRYKVSFVVRFLPRLRGVLPDRAFDAFLRTQAPAPGPSSDD
jgi:NAD(P)-dependent dehydrogenase (short-subunit alcohol dehydrogenase family)